jgi:hypothetical protein
MFKATRDWREDLNGYCQCFSNTKGPFYVTQEACPDTNLCPAATLKILFNGTDKPSQPVLLRAMVETGTFTYKQLVGVLQTLYKLPAETAQVRVSTILRGIVKKEPKMKLAKDDTSRYVLIKRRK